MSQAGRFVTGGGGGSGTVISLTGNSGGPVNPDVFGNIDLLGAGVVTVTGDPGTNTLTISLAGSVATEYDADTGTANPALGILNIDGGTGIQTSGSGNTILIDLIVPVSIADGGTNATSMTDTDGVVYFDGTRLVTTTVGTAGQVLTSNGAGVAPTFQASGGGGVTSIVGDAIGSVAISGALTITGGTSGALFDTTGTTITESFSFLALPDTDNPLTQGYISVNGQPILAFYGGVIRHNTFLGYLSGNAAVAGTRNTGIGFGTLNGLTTGALNTALGDNAAPLITSGNSNTALGQNAFNAGTDSNNNVAVGQNSLSQLTSTGGGDGNNTALGTNALSGIVSGTDNIALGSNAGNLLSAADSSNILIGNAGTSGINNEIIIGTQGNGAGQQNACTIAGIYNAAVGGTNAVVIIDNTGLLGTTGGTGLVNSITGDAGGALTGAITITGGTSGAFYTGTGGNTLTTTFTKLVMSDSTPTTGFISIGGRSVLTSGNSSANGNIFAGPLSGNTTLSGTGNAGLGQTVLNSLTTGAHNVAVGTSSLINLTTGTLNTAVGNQSLGFLVTGVDNIALGWNSGISYTTSESSNIIIGNAGTAAESNVIRIGTDGAGAGQQNAAYMAGITGSAVGATNAIVYCDNTGKLGTTGGTFPSLGTTNHAVQVGNVSGGLTSLAVGTNGQVLVGSAGADPIFATLGSNGSLSYTTGAGTLSIAIAAPVSIANGGTNATSMATTDGTVYYDGTRLVTTTTGTTGQVLTSNGAGVAPTYQTTAATGVTSITGDNVGTIAGAVTLTGGSSGAFYTTSGGNTLTTTFTKLVMSDTTATTGYIQIGTQKVLAAWGGVASDQIFVGEGSGNATLSGIQNAALGGETLASLTSGGANAAVGYHALTACTTGSDNVAVGEISLATLTTGSRNVAVGQAALDVLATGSDNIAIGEGSGSNYSGAESSNILIGDSGTLAESNVIRIGTQGSGAGQQNTAYMAGITGSSVGVTNAIVYCDNTGKLGTTGGTFPSLGTTNHAVQVGNSSGGLTSLTVGTNGQVLVGSSGANPVFATLTSTGSSITYTTGAGTLNLDLTSPVSIAHGGTNATSMATTDGTVYYDGTRLVTTATGTTGQILTSNGAGVAPTYQAAAGGGVTSITGDSVGALTGALTLTGGTSGALFAGSGTTLTESFNFLAMADSTSSSQGYISIGGTKVLAAWPGVASNNIFVGQSAGLSSTTATASTAVGSTALSSLTSGINNTAIGNGALAAATTTTNNVAVGAAALNAATTGNGSNVAIGQGALNKITTGVSNIGIGKQVGSPYGGTESSNILIGNAGTAAESNVIHIGTQGSSAGQQNACFIAGIAGVTVASSAAVLINTSTGQLGTVVSSRRFKENIDDMGAVSRDLHKLRPVKFNFKGDYNESYGLIAEDVEEIMPHLVSYDSEGLPATVKYHELPALLLNEIQRLKLKIDELEGKVNARMR